MKIFLLILVAFISFEVSAESKASNMEYFDIKLLDEANDKLGLVFQSSPVNNDGTQTYELFVERMLDGWTLLGISLIYLDEHEKVVLSVGGMNHCKETDNKCTKVFHIVNSELRNVKLEFLYSSSEHARFRQYSVGGLSALTKH
jgi:hypothetical protein